MDLFPEIAWKQKIANLGRVTCERRELIHWPECYIWG